MDGGAWWGLQSTGRKESDTTERLHFHFPYALFSHLLCAATVATREAQAGFSSPPVFGADFSTVLNSVFSTIYALMLVSLSHRQLCFSSTTSCLLSQVILFHLLLFCSSCCSCSCRIHSLWKICCVLLHKN